ncbi:ABC transporter substrate-binding protein [Streptomyces spongiicola]|uniref:ABC transporter substrate-binding protein n=1 Tax=Streptomyces spongiicola TaxID=1690221 RepID=A0A388SUY4_9ACTN|nr:ABC transporter substrate-binding protein [Streptomyces spongiicola]GBQ00433.1 ABC transporter substrate-binding protein [Streptomyces spongiicola]
MGIRTRHTGRRFARVTALVAGAAATGLLTAACSGTGGGRAEPPVKDWAALRAEARGQTVNLFMYGGDEGANSFVDGEVAPAAEKLGITVRRVPVADTQDAVQKVLGDQRAGKDSGGAVDLVWVNGENFRTGKQADLWLCGYTGLMPNQKYLDRSDPTLTHDFGTPVDDCETPWNRARFAFVYDSARLPEPPRTTAALIEWIKKNPGRFTYPAPPDFTGSAFVRQLLAAGVPGAGPVPAEYGEEAYDAVAPALWKELNALKPALWRQGTTHPKDQPALDDLFADGEVDMTMTYNPAGVPALVDKGRFPATTRVFVPEDGSLGNTSYLAVPGNAAHREAALVLSDLMLSPELQHAKARPGGWGAYPVLDRDRLPEQWRREFASLTTPETTLPAGELSRNALPELSGDWVGPLDKGWKREVAAAS